MFRFNSFIAFIFLFNWYTIFYASAGGGASAGEQNQKSTSNTQPKDKDFYHLDFDVLARSNIDINLKDEGLRDLLRKGLSPNHIIYNEPILFKAADFDKRYGTHFVDILLQEGADPYALYLKSSLLNHAIRTKNEKLINTCLDNMNFDLNKPEFGLTPLVYAIESKISPDLIKKMITLGANPNQKTPERDMIPIHHALFSYPEIIPLLVENGANINQPTTKDDVSVLNALLQEPTEYKKLARLAEILIKLGIDVNERNLTQAIWAGSKELVLNFIENHYIEIIQDDLVFALNMYNRQPNAHRKEIVQIIGNHLQFDPERLNELLRIAKSFNPFENLRQEERNEQSREQNRSQQRQERESQSRKENEALLYFALNRETINERDLKHKYKTLALKLHPDKNLTNIEEASEKMKELNNHYEVLKQLIKQQQAKSTTP